MALFVAAIIFLLIGIGFWLIRRQAKRNIAALADQPPRKGDPDWRAVAAACRIGAIVFISGALVTTFADSLYSIGTKNVGVVTIGGHPDSYLSNGYNFTWPWASVTEMDAAIQTDVYTKDTTAANRIGNCITVRIAYGATACVDVSVRWRITESAAPELFQNYRTFDHVRDSLVTRELNAAMNVVFNGYDPLALNQDGSSAAESLTDLSTAVANLLQQDIGKQIELQNPSVIISVLNFTLPVQARIDALYQQIGDTRVAQQKLLTNRADALANQALAASLSNDPMVLVSKCLDLIAKGFNPPAGFSCWPGAGSSVVVPAGK